MFEEKNGCAGNKGSDLKAKTKGAVEKQYWLGDEEVDSGRK